jgi:hypothetical protein
VDLKQLSLKMHSDLEFLPVADSIVDIGVEVGGADEDVAGERR